MSQEPSAGDAAEPAMGSHEGKWATREDWGKHRDEITSLYKAGNKTLKEVSQHMVKNYDFYATFVLPLCLSATTTIDLHDTNT